MGMTKEAAITTNHPNHMLQREQTTFAIFGPLLILVYLMTHVRVKDFTCSHQVMAAKTFRILCVLRTQNKAQH